MSTDSNAADLLGRVQFALDETAEALSRADLAALQSSMKSLESLPQELLNSAVYLDGSLALLFEARSGCSILLRSLARCGRTIHMLQAAEVSITGQYRPELEG